MASMHKKRGNPQLRSSPASPSPLKRASFLCIAVFFAAWVIFRLTTGELTFRDIGNAIDSVSGILRNQEFKAQHQRNSDRPVADRGIVSTVADGDTMEIRLAEGTLERIRLYGVDAPEYKQRGGKESAAFVKKLLQSQTVTVKTLNEDQYGRPVVLLFLEDGRTVNAEMVRTGHAWVYRNYCRETFCDQWIALEHQAKKQKLGLWQQNNPKPPWKWRRANPRQ